MSLTAERLRSLLTYDPATGLFRWLVKQGRQPAGAVAGVANARGYIFIGVDSRIYLAHRLAWLWMTGEWPKGRLDHKDGLSNAWSNLRPATPAQNAWNAKHHRDNASGFKGATFDAKRNKWQARIRLDGRRITLGYFATAEEASAAYHRAAKEHHGEFYKPPGDKDA